MYLARIMNHFNQSFSGNVFREKKNIISLKKNYFWDSITTRHSELWASRDLWHFTRSLLAAAVERKEKQPRRQTLASLSRRCNKRQGKKANIPDTIRRPIIISLTQRTVRNCSYATEMKLDRFVLCVVPMCSPQILTSIHLEFNLRSMNYAYLFT